MEEILRHIVLFGVHAAAVCLLLAVLFIQVPKGWPMRTITLAVGAVALALPLYSVTDTLGYPDPWPQPGNYDVLGWKFDEARRAIYAFVKKPEASRPQLYKVDFDLQTALDLQEAREHPEHLERIGMNVTPNEEGPPDVTFEFEKRVVIESPAEVAEREAEAQRLREAQQAQLEQERMEDAGMEVEKK